MVSAVTSKRDHEEFAKQGLGYLAPYIPADRRLLTKSKRSQQHGVGKLLQIEQQSPNVLNSQKFNELAAKLHVIYGHKNNKTKTPIDINEFKTNLFNLLHPPTVPGEYK